MRGFFFLGEFGFWVLGFSLWEFFLFFYNKFDILCLFNFFRVFLWEVDVVKLVLDWDREGDSICVVLVSFEVFLGRKEFDLVFGYDLVLFCLVGLIVRLRVGVVDVFFRLLGGGDLSVYF